MAGIPIGVFAMLASAAAAGLALAGGAAPRVAHAGAGKGPVSAAPAERCGWIVNPTPGNWWLDDRDGSWEIGVQGGYQAEGMDRIPDLSARQWVVTNAGSYGYGCGCMRVAVDAKRHRVKRIFSVRQKPLAACRADRRLKRPD